MTAFRTPGVAETTPSLGLIATGQGPRPDYVVFHRGLLQALGIEVEIRLKCMLDGLTPAAIETLAPAPSDDAIHGYVRSPGSTNQRFGADWAEVWMTRRSTVPLVQACIDELERHHVDVIIYCCAEAYPEGVFRATRPLILPARVILSYAAQVVATRDRTTIGVLTRGTRQRPQQLEAWNREPWAHRVSLHFELIGDSPVAAARRLAAVKPDLVLYWGYGVGLAPGDGPDLVASMESGLERPIITAHVASTLLARNFFRPSVDGPAFVLRSR